MQTWDDMGSIKTMSIRSRQANTLQVPVREEDTGLQREASAATRCSRSSDLHSPRSVSRCPRVDVDRFVAPRRMHVCLC